MSGRRDLRDGRKTLWIGDGDVGQDLPVQPHLRLVEPGDEPAVAEAREPGCSIDPDDPQRTEVPLLPGPVTAGVVQRALHGLVCPLVAVLPAAPITLGQLENPVTATARLEALLDPHDSSSVRPVGEQLLDDLLRVHVAKVAGAAIAAVVVGGLGEGEMVLGVGLGVLHLARLLHLEPLLRPTPRLHLRHRLTPKRVLARRGPWGPGPRQLGPPPPSAPPLPAVPPAVWPDRAPAGRPWDSGRGS